MELWFIITVTLCILFLIKSTFNLLFFPNKTTRLLRLPPGPLHIPAVGNLLWFYNSIYNIETVLKKLVPTYGPILTLRIGPRPFIFISSRAMAHQALIHYGAVFADRPPALTTLKIMSSNQHNISSSFYGPTWRTLRRNLTSKLLHATRLRAFSSSRARVMGVLNERLRFQQQQDGVVTRVAEHFQYAMFCLLVVMCFGDEVDEMQVREVERVVRKWLLNIQRFNKLNVFLRLGKVVFYKLWKDFYEIKRLRHDVLASLARARAEFMKEKENDHGMILCYVDTLLELELLDENEKRKLTEEEIVSLCSEFLNAGTDTTTAALQWVMANLVKYPHVQERLFSEIREVVGPSEAEVKEEDLRKMPYLKAVILEGLRRHPPAKFVLGHAVTEDIVLDGYLVSKDAQVNFMVREMGLDPEVWEDPLEFKPERFMNNDDGGSGAAGFDITGCREIKMMPFGVGRRMCPGFQLALLHLEYFVANLVWKFEWKPVNGADVDLAEKSEPATVMKSPLQAQVSPRER